MIFAEQAFYYAILKIYCDKNKKTCQEIIFSTRFLFKKLSDNTNEFLYTSTGILFFLLAAVTIVELIDAHDGFEIITSVITTRKKITLLWLISFITFFLSAILDNLTTAIVMVSLLKSRKVYTLRLCVNDSIKLNGNYFIVSA